MTQKVGIPLLRTNPNGTIPTLGSNHSAGSDLYACINEEEKNCVIPARGRKIVPTGISMVIPNGYYGRIAPRSSLAAKHGLDVGAGVIDSDYRGTIGVVLFNHSDQDYIVKNGDRIAQLIITPFRTPEFIELFQSLENTSRGNGGFGSTGI
jgi:dUTP pyrophosphatase